MLRFGLNPSAWRLYSIRNHDSKFETLKSKILARDKHTCRYCNFNCFIDMCVVNKDYNYKNNVGDNLVTACVFCAQCHFLPMIGSDNFKGGDIIYAPEFSQEELNSLCHVIFCAILNGSDQAEFMQTLYNNLRLRSNIIEEKLGKGLSEPRFFAQMIIDTPLENKDKITANILSSARLLPSRNNFAEHVINWSAKSLEDFKLPGG